jgi:hypothetical protein
MDHHSSDCLSRRQILAFASDRHRIERVTLLSSRPLFPRAMRHDVAQEESVLTGMDLRSSAPGLPGEGTSVFHGDRKRSRDQLLERTKPCGKPVVGDPPHCGGPPAYCRHSTNRRGTPAVRGLSFTARGTDQ